MSTIFLVNKEAPARVVLGGGGVKRREEPEYEVYFLFVKFANALVWVLSS